MNKIQMLAIVYLVTLVANVLSVHAKSWEFNSSTEGWIGYQVSNFSQSSGAVGGLISGVDPQIYSPSNLDVDIVNNTLLKIKIKNNTSDTTGTLFFITNEDGLYSPSKSKNFIIEADSDYIEYIVDMSSVPSWTGTLKQLRIDPVHAASSGSFSVDHIRIVSTKISWDFTSGVEEWTSSLVSSFSQLNGEVGGDVLGADPQILSVSNLDVDIDHNKIIKVRLANGTSSTVAQVYFTTNDDTVFNDAKHKNFPVAANSNLREYTVDMSDIIRWNGTLKQLRIDPEHGSSSGAFAIDYIRIQEEEIGWDFTSSIEGWVPYQISSFSQENGEVGGDIAGLDPQIYSPSNLNLDITDKKVIRIKLKNETSSTLGQIFFVTNSSPVYDEIKYKEFAIEPVEVNSGYTEYTIDMSGVEGWTGTLKQLRVDPSHGASSGAFSIDYIRVIRIEKYGWEFASNAEGWEGYQISNFGQQNNNLSGTIVGSDPQIYSPSNLNLDIANNKIIKLRLANMTSSSLGQIFFTTNDDAVFNEAKHKDFTIVPNSSFIEYTVDMSNIDGWAGMLKQIRVDLEHGASSGSFALDYIRLQETKFGKGNRIVAYYPYWESSILTPEFVPYSKLTHIIHVGVSANVDGSLNVPAGYLSTVLNTNAYEAGVKIIVGVHTPNLPLVAANETLREIFAENLVTFCSNNFYDGVDFDWEYPQNQVERTSFTLLLQEVRASFDSTEPKWSVSIAVSGVDYWNQWVDYNKIDSSITFYNLMGYDMHGDWSATSGHNASLFRGADLSSSLNLKSFVNNLMKQGVSAQKINAGVPFYARKFVNSEILYDDCNGDCTTIAYAYKDIVPLVGNGWTFHWDAGSCVPYLTYDSGAGLITYDDPESIGLKVEYVLNTLNIGGVFMWELAQDYSSGQPQPLLDAMFDALMQ